MDSNDAAYIKIARECRQLEIGLGYAEIAKTMITRLRNTDRQYGASIATEMRKLQTSTNAPPFIAALIPFMTAYTQGEDHMAKWITDSQKRIGICRELMDAYELGEDVVQRRLAMDDQTDQSSG